MNLFSLDNLAVETTMSKKCDIIRVTAKSRRLLKTGQPKRRYAGVRDCFKRVFKEEGFFSFWRGNQVTEGFFSFWRGNQVTVIRYFPTQCCRRSKDISKVCLGGQGSEVGIEVVYWQCCLWKCCWSCYFTVIISYGLYSTTRTHLAADSTCISTKRKRQFKGIFDVSCENLETDGVRGCIADLGSQLWGLLCTEECSFRTILLLVFSWVGV